jgi:hypothetical protein
MGLEGAALLAAAIRAAIQAKAPRRTVQAVAAAVTGVLWRPTAANTPQVDARAQAGTPVAEVRANRMAQRQRKKDRRRDAAAKAPDATSSTGPVVLQCDTVRAAGSCEVAVAAIAGCEAMGSRRAKRRKKGGRSFQSSGALGSRNVEAFSGAEVLQSSTVRASAPMVTADEGVGEVLDDYWADAGGSDKPLALEVQLYEVADAPMDVSVVGLAVDSGAKRRALLKNYERQKKFLSAVCANAALGRGSSEAQRTRRALEVLEVQLGIVPNLTGIRRRDG